MNGEFGYSRQVPTNFADDGDDLFMRSMISNYALEGKACDASGCKGNGKFFLNDIAARQAASEVLATHKGLKGKALDQYLTTYFPKAWAHFDVNQVGVVEVSAMPQFMRFLASDQTLSLGEA